MTLLFFHFSSLSFFTVIFSSTHVLLPNLSIVNCVLPKIKLAVQIGSCTSGYESTRLRFRITTKKIDNIAQRSNSFIVFSSGNIELDDGKTALSEGAIYPDYLNQVPVLHPSDEIGHFCLEGLAEGRHDFTFFRSFLSVYSIRKFCIGRLI